MKRVDMVAMVIALAVLVLGIYLWIANGFWYLAAFVVVLHLVEVFVKGLPLGRKAGYSTTHSVLMTMLFGFTWWLPIQRQYGEE